MNTIYNVSALASAGKTYRMTRAAHSLALRDEWVLIVQPTVALIEEAAAGFRTLTPTVSPEVIHGGNAENVTAAILAALKTRPGTGRVLFITWSAFIGLPFFPAPQFWTVFVDEVPQVAKVDDLNLSWTHSHLTDHVELLPKGPVWGVVCKTRPERDPEVGRVPGRSAEGIGSCRANAAVRELADIHPER